MRTRHALTYVVLFSYLHLCFGSFAWALPDEGQVAGGSATISQPTAQTLHINQATDKAIINWRGFNIGADELVKFAQPNAGSIALNRVVGGDPSAIMGQLLANGRVFLINPNGILFGSSAVVNTAGLLATTFNIKDSDFMAGKFSFAQDPTKALSYVINKGQIHVSDNGFVLLVAPAVSNEGLIVANLGKVALGSGEKLMVDFMGDGLITYAIDGKVLEQVKGPDGKPLSSAVSNSGTIQADGGQVLLSARAASDVFSSVINQSGVIEARSLVNRGGVIRLEGSDPVANTGTLGWQANLGKVQNEEGKVINTGTLNVSAAEPGAAPGEVTISGEMVGVAGTILARGAEGAQGGRVLISSTDKTIVTSDSLIDTSGGNNSSAGNVVIWSDKNTQFGGSVVARGGGLGGNGGQIEVSGHNNLGFNGQIDTQAPNGTMGLLLLDPTNIIVAIGGGATTGQVNQFADPDGGCTGGVPCTIAPATINVNANITLQADNDITVTNAIAKANAGTTLTMQAGRNININANVSTTNAAIFLTANDAGAGAGRAAGAGSITGGGNISSGSGLLNLTLGTNAGGAGSINLTGTLTSSGTTTINAGAANDVTLNNAANNFGTVAITSGNNVTLRDTNALIFGNSTVSGNLNVTTGGAMTDSGIIAVTGTTTLAAGAGNSITLNSAGNNFGTVAITSGNNVTLVDTNAIDLGASTISGTLGVTSAGAITQSGALNVAGNTTLAAGAANNITLNNAGNIFGNVRITSGNNVTLADATALNLTASTVSGNLDVTANGAITDSGALTVAGTTTLAAGAANNITLNNANNFNTVSITSGNNVTLRDTNAIDLGASTISGTLGVTSAGAITQSGALNVTGTTTLAAGAANNITLNDAGNIFGTVGITSGNNVLLTDSTALNFAASTVSGTLGVTTNGALTQTGALTVTGTTTLAAGAANNITLNNAGNNFSTVGITSGNNVNLRDVNALILGASTVSGTFDVTTAGALTQSGPLTATGATTLAAGAANNITLNNAANNFSTVSITSGNNVALTDTNALDLAASTISGTLGVTTNGALTQSGALTVIGITTLAAGAANNITLNNAANNFSTIGVTSGNNVTLRDANALILGASTVSGAFDVTTNGALTQSGALTVTGTTTLAAGAANNITLNNAANNFSTVGIASGNTVTLVDANALDLGASTVSGNLVLTTGGALTQTGALAVTGTTQFTATAANTDVLLGTQANNFGGALSFAGTQANFRDVQLRNVNAGATVPALAGLTNLRNLTLTFNNAPVALPALTLTAGGSLNVTAGGAITDSGNLIVPGTTTLTAGANNITLDNANNFTGAVSVTSGNNVTLNDTNALILGASTVSGTLNVTTAGAVTQSGALTVTGVTTLAAGAANNITLNNAANNFSTVGITTGNNVTLTDANALILGASTVSGTLGVTTTGALTQSGALAVTGTTTLAAGAANNITLNNAGNNFSTVGITSGNNVALTDANALILGASTVSGTLGVTTTGALTQSGALTVAGTTTLAAGAANNITLNNAANNFSTVGVTSGNNVVLTDANALDLGASTISGTMGVTTTGALTQSGALTVTGVTTLAAGAANNITLNNAGNNFSTVGITSGNNVALTDINALILGASTVSGTLGVTAGGLISQSGALSVAGNASFTTTAAPTLGSVSLTNGGALTLGTSTVGGNLTVSTTAGDITLPGGQTLTVVGDATLTPAGTVNLLGPTQIGGTQTFNGGSGSTFVLAADTNLNGLALPAAGNITVNLTGTRATFAGAPLLPAAVTLSNAGNSFGGAVSVTTAAPAFTGTVTNTYHLTQSAPVALNPGQGLTATDLGGTAGTRGNITLTNPGNTFNTVTFTGGDIAWQQANAVTIGSVSANAGATSTGALTITANGPITQSGVVTATGPTTLAAGVGNNIILTNAANDFSTVGITSGNNVTLNDTNALILGASTVSGALGVTTNGALTQSGALSVAGTMTLAAGPGNDIILNNAANDFSTVGVTTGNNVALTDTNALDLGAATVVGTLTVATNGALTQSGALTVAGTTTLAAGAGNDITLNNAANDFSTVGIASGNNVTLRDSNALGLGTLTPSGNLNVTANGAITDANGPANNITATTANLTGASIGTAGDPIETNLGTLNAATSAGGIFVTEAGPITLNNVVAGTGNVLINNATGDMTINTVTATSGGVDLTAASGSILDGNGTSNNVTASANSSLSALGGVVGLGPDPIEVNVNGGTLSVAASNQVNGISVTINGTVSPSNALQALNAPPGLILFNGNAPPSQSVVGGAIGSLSLGSFMRNSTTLEPIRDLPTESQVVVLVVEDSEPETLLAGEADGFGTIGRQVEAGNGTVSESGVAVSSLIPSLSGVVPGDSVAGENGAAEHRLQEEQVAVAMGKSIEAGHRENGSGGRDNSGTHDTVLAQGNAENGHLSLTEKIEQGLDTPEGAALKNDVLFGFESWRISDQGIQALMKVAEWLKANPKKRLIIEGHCDERGSVAYNLMLGEKRAKAVKNILVTFGVNAKQVKVVSYGKERPICNASNEACYQQNRRGHFVLRVP